MQRLYTIGYEGRTIDEFVDTLVPAGVYEVVDVRATPISRKKGFSKNALRETLTDKNYGYYHFGDLGTPKALRDELKRTKDYAGFFAKYRDYIIEQRHANPQLDIIDKFIALGFETGITYCLMCYERDYRKCHRSVLADYLAELNPALTVVHL